MNDRTVKTDDPIAPELLRTRLEAIGQEAGAAVEQTAISPIVTESKDYSVTICDGRGSIISATSAIELHFGAAMHAIRSTIARHGDGIAEGDVFLANDPHSGGGLHPQDVIIQRPVFFDGKCVAWVALAAHMMDMGGMVPGSSAVQATECYQEALRFPPVRIIKQHREVTDIWDILRINIRSADLIEMDMRSLVIGSAVAEKKLRRLLDDMGVETFESATRSLLESTKAVLRDRIDRIEDGRYRATGWVEYRDTALRIPCELVVSGDRLVFDLTRAPVQVPHFFNSKPYIIRAMIAPHIRYILAPGLPYNQALFDLVELETSKGTVVDCEMPAPIGAAHMDAAIAVNNAAMQCLQLAIHASPDSYGREYMTAPTLAAYATGRWTYLDEAGQRRVFTIIDGAFCGSPAAHHRDGIDIKSGIISGGSKLEYSDVEILEAAYPILFRERTIARGEHGYGARRSGAGCRESFGPHGTDSLVCNMTGTRSWFPTPGGAGGLPGARMRFAVNRANGEVEPIHIQQVGVALNPGDNIQMFCASGGGYGDPLDRDPLAVLTDLMDDRIDNGIAREVYGLVLTAAGDADLAATENYRERLRKERLKQAQPARKPVAEMADQLSSADGENYPLYPGIVQRGNLAIADQSDAVLAVAPDNWLDGCPMLETKLDDRDGGVFMWAYLDPVSGRLLYVDVSRARDESGIEIIPERWATATADQPTRQTTENYHGQNHL